MNRGWAIPEALASFGRFAAIFSRWPGRLIFLLQTLKERFLSFLNRPEPFGFRLLCGELRSHRSRTMLRDYCVLEHNPPALRATLQMRVESPLLVGGQLARRRNRAQLQKFLMRSHSRCASTSLQISACNTQIIAYSGHFLLGVCGASQGLCSGDF